MGKKGKGSGRGVNQKRGHKTTKRDLKVKNKTKHLDEIDSDLKPKIAKSLLNQEIDYDLPGKGQNYCLHCARYGSYNCLYSHEKHVALLQYSK